jgi:hypothetical protein
MRILVLVAVATAFATASGCGSDDSSTRTGGSTRGPREVAVAWQVVAVREGGRVLVLRYRAGGCLRGDGRAVLTESDERVAIAVREHRRASRAATDPLSPESCSSEARLDTLRVRLRQPLAGRAITGGPRLPDLSHAKAKPLA